MAKNRKTRGKKEKENLLPSPKFAHLSDDELEEADDIETKEILLEAAKRGMRGLVYLGSGMISTVEIEKRRMREGEGSN